MKMILALMLSAFSTSVGAQAYQPPADPGVFDHSGPPVPNLRVPFDGWHAGDTPTMWQQRQKRVVAFQAKVADRLQANDGRLSPDDRRFIEREWRKLRYHNR
ncbi:hypothetical protein FHT00_002237 [Sphingomonas insulae]|uniref:Uncharacterized protein n=1 Tax=Sphingomonas insulae TaxID=424800 RepID=A0ABN1HL93_9SPHN|nr:hypothetical protein [Sphingomonas insulae]NIJ30274.1 hypothetical protein [Sphingomonas insulae]